jgi:hypothetical protein
VNLPEKDKQIFVVRGTTTAAQNTMSTTTTKGAEAIRAEYAPFALLTF